MSTLSQVQAIVANIAKIPNPTEVPIDADLYRDVGVRSTAALDLLLTLEEQFEVAIPDDAFGDARTTSTLAGLIEQLGG